MSSSVGSRSLWGFLMIPYPQPGRSEKSEVRPLFLGTSDAAGALSSLCDEAMKPC